MTAQRSPEDRLLDCFVSVFPTVPVADLRRASMEATPGWDSIALATLIAAVEEEFEIVLPPAAYPELHSFSAFFEQINALR